jgi:hypothetical protein
MCVGQVCAQCTHSTSTSPLITVDAKLDWSAIQMAQSQHPLADACMCPLPVKSVHVSEFLLNRWI